jgi:hypothetical protein
MSLLTELVQRLPGAQLRGADPARRLIFQFDGAWLDARARESPVVEIFIRTSRLPFRMRVRPGYEIETEDSALAGLWLDPPAEAALRAIGDFDVFYEGGEVLLTRDSVEDADALAQALRAAAVVAMRPQRLAAEWLELAHALGGSTTSDRWDCDGGFQAVFERGAATVHIDNYFGDPPVGLRTRVHARRVAPDGDRWALWSPKIPRGYRPQVDASEKVTLDRWSGVAADSAALLGKLRPLDSLLGEANPDAMWTDGSEVALWWTGMATSPIWLGPAVELVARLAIEALGADGGPYR